MNALDVRAFAGVEPAGTTMTSLSVFSALVERWNRKINLVAPSTVAELWTRHVCDSLQLYPLLPVHGRRMLDFGSGGGFPGVVLAILLQQIRPDVLCTLVESDRRKAVFLAEAVRTCGLSNVRIENARIEAIPLASADMITARALAPLTDLLAMSFPHLQPSGVCLFPKGRSWQQELAALGAQWDYELDCHASRTDPESRILRFGALRRRPSEELPS